MTSLNSKRLSQMSGIHSRRGFTLVELMVALTAGSLVVSSVYFIGAASSRHFQEQHRIAQTQMALRAGMEQLRRDIARAGFLGTPNSARDIVCLAPPRQLQAIEFQNDVDTAAIPNAGENGVTADRLRLVGNYATSDQYFVTNLVSAAGNQIVLQRSWQGFQRSFVNPSTGVFDAQAYQDAFRAGRMLHIQTANQNHFFVTITANNPGAGTVTFAPPLPIGGTCVGGLADGAVVAPLSRIEYFIGNLGGVLDAQNAQVVGQATQLIRREIQFDALGTPVPNTERVVVEYAVDFNLDFILDTAAVPGAAPNLVRLTGALAAPMLADVNVSAAAVPHRVRNVLASVSVRTPEQDRRFGFIARAANTPVTRFRVDPTRPGAARVRTLVSEVFVPNVANRGFRP